MRAHSLCQNAIEISIASPPIVKDAAKCGIENQIVPENGSLNNPLTIYLTPLEFPKSSTHQRLEEIASSPELEY